MQNVINQKKPKRAIDSYYRYERRHGSEQSEDKISSGTLIYAAAAIAFTMYFAALYVAPSLPERFASNYDPNKHFTIDETNYQDRRGALLGSRNSTLK